MSTTTDPQRLLMALDALNKQKIDANAKDGLLQDRASQEADLKERLRAMLTHQNVAVDDAALNEVIRATREPVALEYDPPDVSPLTQKLFTLHQTRSQWLAPVIGMGVLSISLIIGMQVFAGYQERKLAHDIQTSTADLAKWAQTQQHVNTLLIRWPTSMGQSGLKAKAQPYVDIITHNVVLGNKIGAVDNQQEVDQVSALVEQSNKAINDFQAVVSESKTLSDLADQFNKFPSTLSSSWEELNAQYVLKRNQASQHLSVADMPQAREDIQAMEFFQNAQGMKLTLQQLAQSIPSIGSEKAQALLAQGQVAILSGNSQSYTSITRQLGALADQINQAYTLKIVNEPDEPTGFYREYDQSGARNYYIKVDALDASGQPVKLDVVNEEDNSRERVSRFAVRVPQSFFEQVKADKKDNGLIDNAILGSKEPNTLEPTYTIPVPGGVITHW